MFFSRSKPSAAYLEAYAQLLEMLRYSPLANHLACPVDSYALDVKNGRIPKIKLKGMRKASALLRLLLHDTAEEVAKKNLVIWYDPTPKQTLPDFFSPPYAGQNKSLQALRYLRGF